VTKIKRNDRKGLTILNGIFDRYIKDDKALDGYL
jgi:hypothetical protein